MYVFVDLLRSSGEPSKHHGLAGLAQVLEYSSLRPRGKSSFMEQTSPPFDSYFELLDLQALKINEFVGLKFCQNTNVSAAVTACNCSAGPVVGLT